MADTSELKCAEAASQLYAAFRSRKTLSYEWRLGQLESMRKMVKENETAIHEAIGRDLGRGLFEAGGLEILPLTLEIDHAINNLKSWMAPVYTKLPAIAAPSTSEIQYEPFGVVLVIAPFNYPIYLALGPLLGAIAAGDCALLKPSELTKASEALLMKLVPQYLDNDCYKVIAGGIATTTHLLNQRWDKIFFTGSTRVGAVVLQAAVKHMTPVALELGGKSPTIIDQSVTDLDLVAKRVMWGKLINSGQTCIAPDYVLCHSSKYKEFLISAEKCLKNFYGSDIQKSTDFGRIVSSGHCDRLKGLLQGNPGRIVTGGKVDVSDHYVEPTIIADCKLDSKIMREEIFGPLLPVMSYSTTEEAISIINSDNLRKPLALYIFSKDRTMIDTVTSSVSSGGVVVNDTIFHVMNPYIPFGGVGGSGMGGYHGFFSFEAFSHRRSIMRRDDKFITDAPFRYPPYSKFNLSLFQMAAKLPDLHSITGTTFCLGLIAAVVAVAAGINYGAILSAVQNVL